MGYSPPSILPGPGAQNRSDPVAALGFPSETTQPDPVAVLRQSLAADAYPTASVLRATVEAARILTAASGAAVALRTKGMIVCRARSGGLAPELGAPLNINSGISGECVRRSAVLLCHDAATDSRVDREACAALGVRSMVMVPLRGPTGVAGILEAFSTRAYAFGDEQIRSLTGLAEIAEAAYERECHSAQEAAVPLLRPAPVGVPPARTPPTGSQSVRPTGSRPVAFAATPVTSQGRGAGMFDEPSPRRRYWILAVAAVALLLTAGVAWFAWREPVAELAASEAQPRTLSTQEPTSGHPSGHSSGHPAETIAPPKPGPGIALQRGEPAKAAGVLQNAAEIEVTEHPQRPALARNVSPVDREERTSASAALSNESPPAVTVATSVNGDQLASLVSGPKTLPELEVEVSQGVTQGQLLRKVDPVYPVQARAQRLAGSVDLDITVGVDGSVHDIKVVDGSPMLASAATDAVRQWRYSPILLNGKPVSAQKRITVVFKLP